MRDEEVKTIIFIDGMAFLHQINLTPLKTYDDIAIKVMEIIVNKLKYSDEVQLIFDRYDDTEPNPKDAERFCRYGAGGRKYDIKSGKAFPDFQKLLGNNNNKSDLKRFICI